MTNPVSAAHLSAALNSKGAASAGMDVRLQYMYCNSIETNKALSAADVVGTVLSHRRVHSKLCVCSQAHHITGTSKRHLQHQCKNVWVEVLQVQRPPALSTWVLADTCRSGLTVNELREPWRLRAQQQPVCREVPAASNKLDV